MIDVSYARRGRTGTGVYVDELVRALRARDDVEVVCVRQRRRLRPGGGATRCARRPTSRSTSAWTRVGLPRAASPGTGRRPAPPAPRALPRSRLPAGRDGARRGLRALPGGLRPRLAGGGAARAPGGGGAGRRRSSARPGRPPTTRRGCWGVSGARRWWRPTARVRPCRKRRAAERRHFLYLGADEPRKRVGSLVEAHAGLSARPGARRRGGAARRTGRRDRRGRPRRPRGWPSCSRAPSRWCTRRRWRASGSRCWRRWPPGTPVVAVRSPGQRGGVR